MSRYQRSVVLVTWLWRNGWRPGMYDHRHVNRLYRQLQRHMTGKWKLVCVTDDPTGIECETFPLWSMPEPLLPELKDPTPNCYARLKLFDPGTACLFGADLLVSIDLDTTVYRDLSPLFTDEPFKIMRNERADTAKYCGTLWQLRPGAHPEVWRDYDPVLTPHITYTDLGLYGSDQAWLSHKIPDAPTWGPRDGVLWNKRCRTHKLQDGVRLIYFAGDTKPWDEKCRLTHPALYTPL